MTRVAVASTVSGLALLVGAPVAWTLAQPPDTVGEVPATVAVEVEADAELPGASEPRPAAEPAPAPPPGREPETAPVPEAAPEPEPEPAPEVAPVPGPSPASLSIPAIGIDAPVVPVGLEDDGAMEIPHDVSTVGWYDLGVLPGETGTAVLAGHVDSREQGRGAFWDLGRLDVGDVITVGDADGSSSAWQVTARTVYPKDELPIEDIFTRFGDARMVLITCGGDFDRSARHYEDNVVVYTEPVAPAAT